MIVKTEIHRSCRKGIVPIYDMGIGIGIGINIVLNSEI